MTVYIVVMFELTEIFLGGFLNLILNELPPLLGVIFTSIKFNVTVQVIDYMLLIGCKISELPVIWFKLLSFM